MRFGRCPSGTMMGSVPRLWRSISQRMGLSTLVLAEQKGGRLDPSTAQAVSAARALGGPVTLLFSGRGLGGAPSAGAALEGVTAVLTADDEALDHQLAEPAGALIVAVQQRRSFTHILAPSSTHGRNLLPRAAAKLDVQAVADVVEVQGPCTFVRPIYAGNALATVETPAEGLQMLTVRTTSFPPAPARAGNPAAIEPVSAEELQAAKDASSTSAWVSEEVGTSERPDLGQARVVVSGGRALRSAENFALLEALADALGGAVGASRAAVDAGYVPNDLQVGQTGKVVAPDLYLAFGISGAIQHVAGIKDAKTIVAVNTDADAPIFEVADYGLVGDLFEVIPQLQAELAAAKAQ
uniref:Electron transfer flavoprotein subunit alpha n=1 Tax=Auxenochlorella protothecoides TaxID=3075 RepID=A0A1D2ADZ6_AUXPR